ncbi:tetratricopeptide repeat protein [Baaleninema simplex]|uniref:tetratricopeptide repeat protein n=1 Tax=Baaleninema simplex TaxID=2862350 RepID=UPI00034BA828|nr:tetratricopeptide repeat protein [Baaleninema simplex]
MPQRHFWISLLVAVGLAGTVEPARGQALIPHTLQLDAEQLEEIGVSLIQEADRWARFQQYEQALPRAELGTELLPDNAQAWGILGHIYVNVDRLEEGIEALETARSLAPEDATVRFALGLAHFQAQEYDRAIDELNAGLDLQPDVPGALFDLGNAYYMRGDFGDAIERYENAFEQNGDFWPAINNAGLVRYEMGQVDRALDLWRQSADIAPRQAEPKLAMAAALYARGDVERGLALAEEALQLDVRYAELEFLELNLWGDRLIDAAQQLLSTPRVQAIVARVEETAPPFSIQP